MFPGGQDMEHLLAQAQKLQEQLIAAQERLASTVIEGSAGGGLVRARVSGAGELLGLEIAPEVVDPDDTETLSDLVVAAVRDAAHNAEQAKAHALGPLAEGLGGFGGANAGAGSDLGGLFGDAGGPSALGSGPTES